MHSDIEGNPFSKWGPRSRYQMHVIQKACTPLHVFKNALNNAF